MCLIHFFRLGINSQKYISQHDRHGIIIFIQNNFRVSELFHEKD